MGIDVVLPEEIRSTCSKRRRSKHMQSNQTPCFCTEAVCGQFLSCAFSFPSRIEAQHSLPERKPVSTFMLEKLLQTSASSFLAISWLGPWACLKAKERSCSHDDNRSDCDSVQPGLWFNANIYCTAKVFWVFFIYIHICAYNLKKKKDCYVNRCD